MNNHTLQMVALWVASALLNAALRADFAAAFVTRIATYKVGAYALATLRTLGADPAKLITMGENLAAKAISDKMSGTETK